jgi:hypothetical protein
MPVDPRELERSSGYKPDIVLSDRECVRCSYNLKGLPTNGKCPECGLPIGGGSNRFKRINHNLSDAPISYLRALSIGLAFMAFSCVGGAFAFIILGGAQRALGVGIAGILWWMGVFLVTVKRPMTENTPRDSTLDSRRLRTLNRTAQASWAAASIPLLMAIQAPPPVNTIAAWMGALLLFAGLLALVPVSLHLSALADWAAHTDLAGRFRLAVWGVCVCGFLVAVTLPGAGFKSLAGLLLLTVSLFILCLFFAQLLFIVSLFQLVMTVQWAIRNAEFAGERAQRLADRTARGEEPERPCPECGYDLRGLHPLARCPECGHRDLHASAAGVITPPLETRHPLGDRSGDDVIPLEPEKPGANPPQIISRSSGITRKPPPPGHASL